MSINKGLFKSLVTKSNGKRIKVPNSPYEHMIIERDREYILSLDFIEYEGRELEFIKEINPYEKRRQLPEHVDVKPIDVNGEIESNEEIEIIEEIEQKEENLDKYEDRSQYDAHMQLQNVAYDMDPVRKGEGLSNLKNMTIHQIYLFTKNVRKLPTKESNNSKQMPSKNEWVSIALHGFTEKVDKDKFQYNTKSWAYKWYTKEILEKLYKEKGVPLDSFTPPLTKKKLFDKAWNLNWMSRDPWIEEIPYEYKKEPSTHKHLKKKK